MTCSFSPLIDFLCFYIIYANIYNSCSGCTVDPLALFLLSEYFARLTCTALHRPVLLLMTRRVWGVIVTDSHRAAAHIAAFGLAPLPGCSPPNHVYYMSVVAAPSFDAPVCGGPCCMQRQRKEMTFFMARVSQGKLEGDPFVRLLGVMDSKPPENERAIRMKKHVYFSSRDRTTMSHCSLVTCHIW